MSSTRIVTESGGFWIEPELATLGLRAMKSVAIADGDLSASERALLETAAKALRLDPSVVEQLPAIDAAELATKVPRGIARERIVQGMILTALMDERATDEEACLIEGFARTLEISDPRVANLKQLAAGRVRTMWIDIARRSFARPVFERALRDDGLRGLWKIVAPMVGLGQDPALARRYCDLGLLPEGTLGRGYFRFIVDNDLGFPGEGIVAEQGVWHDLTHLLSGYGTDPEGEVQVVSFIAGYRKDDPFFWLFTIALQFHLGIKVSPYSPGLHGHFDPARVLAAFERGAQMNIDLSEGWDYWADMATDVGELRRRFGVPHS